MTRDPASPNTLMLAAPGYEDVVDRLAAFFRQSPRHYGTYFQAVRLWGSAPRQARFLGSLANHRLRTYFRSGVDAAPDSAILIDARYGGRQAALWLPVARTLAENGVRVTLAHSGEGPPQDVTREERQRFGTLTMLHYATGPVGRGEPQDGASAPVPKFGRLFDWVLRALMSASDDLINAWCNVLRGSPVRMVISAEVSSLWSGALLTASRDVGIHTVYLQQGMTNWPCPMCSLAFVWSPVSEKLIRMAGWEGTRVVIARNPSIPGPGVLNELRRIRRQQLGIGEGTFCVLIVGQKSVDQRFIAPGYIPTVTLIREALAAAARSTGDLAALLRPHYNDHGQETERLLKESHGLRLLVSTGSDLMADVAASDVVVGMDSAALEEAYLTGRPIVQALAAGYRSDVDFSLVGVPLVHDASNLADLLLQRGWIASTLPVPRRPEIGDVLLEMLSTDFRGPVTVTVV